MLYSTRAQERMTKCTIVRDRVVRLDEHVALPVDRNGIGVDLASLSGHWYQSGVEVAGNRSVVFSDRVKEPGPSNELQPEKFACLCWEEVTVRNSVFVRFVPLLVSVAVMTASPSAYSDEEPEQRTLGVLIFPGFELLDAYGPLEMWGNLKKQVKVVIVAAEAGPVKSAQGPATVAEYNFDDCPELDLILVPGGFGVLPLVRSQPVLKWLQDRSAQAEITMSVCNGASVLAAAGLLDGRKATTNKAYWKMATGPGKKVNWVAQARWVDDGNMVTSSGVSAGMDMSLHVIQRLYGEDAAVRLAAITEYEWHRDPAWDPFAEMHGLVKAGDDN